MIDIQRRYQGNWPFLNFNLENFRDKIYRKSNSKEFQIEAFLFGLKISRPVAINIYEHWKA